jgi:hypothetical protein
MGSRKGIKNKRTILREQRIAEATRAVADRKADTSDVRKDGVQVMEEAMLYFLASAEQERRLGDKGDRAKIREDMKTAAVIAKDVAQYHRPKITAIRMGGDPNAPPHLARDPDRCTARFPHPASPRRNCEQGALRYSWRSGTVA